MDPKGRNPSTSASSHGMGIFTDKHYCVLWVNLMKPRQPLVPLKTPGKPTDAEKVLAADHWAPVVANCGTYDLKGTALNLHPSTDKSEPPPVAKLELTFEGKTLSIFNISANRRTKWTRLE